MKFKCACCDEELDSIPSFGWSHPLHYWHVPEDKREEDVFLTDDLCVITNKWFFVRGCIEIPVVDHNESFAWGVWVSLSEKNFFEFQDLFDQKNRAHHGPYFGWLASSINMYPDTQNLKTMVHLRDNGIRPYVELEQNGHPLAIEQRDGITLERVAEIYACMMHRSTLDHNSPN